MARPERLELPTLWFEARCSIQLSYGRTRTLFTINSLPPFLLQFQSRVSMQSHPINAAVLTEPINSRMVGDSKLIQLSIVQISSGSRLVASDLRAWHRSWSVSDPRGPITPLADTCWQFPFGSHISIPSQLTNDECQKARLPRRRDCIENCNR
jgi:hypothetical protein